MAHSWRDNDTSPELLPCPTHAWHFPTDVFWDLWWIFPNHSNPDSSEISEVQPAPRYSGAAPRLRFPTFHFHAQHSRAPLRSILSPLSNLFLWLHHKNSLDLGSSPGIFAYVYPSFSQHSLAARWENRRSLQHLSATPPFSCAGNRGGNEVVFQLLPGQTLGYFHRDQGKGEGKHMESIKGPFPKFICLTERRRFLCGPLEKWDHSTGREQPAPEIPFSLDFTPCPAHGLGALNPMAHTRIYPKEPERFWGKTLLLGTQEFQSFIYFQSQISVFGM